MNRANEREEEEENAKIEFQKKRELYNNHALFTWSIRAAYLKREEKRAALWRKKEGK